MPFLSVEEALLQAGSTIERAASLLWELDENRLRPGTEYALDLQGQVEGSSFAVAPRKLFKTWADAIWKRKTFRLFQQLLDKHDSRYIPEYTSDEDLAFILAICETPCIRFVRRWLMQKGHIQPGSMTDFSTMLFAMWFTPHPGLKRDSTGFQHVFCGDIKKNYLSGLHNFVRVFLEERRGNLEYMGYVTTREKGGSLPPQPNQQMFTIRFTLHERRKRMSTMFFGVSPEFEFGLYTLLSVAGCSLLQVKLGMYKANIKVVKVKGKIRVAFPKLLALDYPALSRALTPSAPTPVPLPVLGKRQRAGSASDANSHDAGRKKRRTNLQVAAEVMDLTVDLPKAALELVDLTKGAIVCTSGTIDVDEIDLTVTPGGVSSHAGEVVEVIDLG